MDVDHIYLLYITQRELIRAKNTINRTKFIDSTKVTYWRGVIGAESIEYPTYKQQYLKAPTGHFLTQGAYGHVKSMIAILENAVEKKYQKILLLEPDVYFAKDEIELPKDYKLLYLGASQYCYFQEKTWDKIQLDDTYFAYKTLGTFAVAIDVSLFNEYMTELRTLKHTSDVQLTILQEKYYGECYVVYPNLACCDVTGSQTGTGKNQLEWMQKYKWTREYDITDMWEIDVKDGDRIKIDADELSNSYVIISRNEECLYIGDITNIQTIIGGVQVLCVNMFVRSVKSCKQETTTS